MLQTILDYLRTPLLVLSGTPVSALTILTAIFLVVVAKIMSSTVINYSQPTHERRFQVDIGVAYGTDLEFAAKVIVDVAKAEPKVLSTPAPEVRHMGFGDSSIHLILLVWIAEAKEDLIV